MIAPGKTCFCAGLRKDAPKKVARLHALRFAAAPKRILHVPAIGERRLVHAYEDVPGSAGTCLHQIPLQPFQLTCEQSPKWVSPVLLPTARIPIIRIELREMATGVMK